MTKSVIGRQGPRMAKEALAAGVCALALVISAGGCDTRSDSAKAVDNGARDLEALTAASPEPAMKETQQKALTKVSSDMSGAISNGSVGEKAAASLMVSQSQGGLGEGAAADAGILERKALNMITEIDAQLTQWCQRSSTAASADSYDPSEARAQIAKSKQEKDAAIKVEQDHRATVEAQLNDLKGRAKTKLDGASAKDAQYGELTQRAVRLTATEAVPVVEQANKIKREGDALLLDGTKLDAQAQSIAPQITEIDAIISQLTNQKKDLEAADATLVQRLAASKAEAAEARAGATAAGVEIEKGMGALAKLHADEVDPAFAKALGLFTKASTAARDASQQAPAAGKAAVGDAQLSIADMHWQKAEGLRTYAALLESLSKAEPALPQRADYTAKAKAASDQAKQELEAAGTAIEAAKTAFKSTGLRGDVKDRLDKLGDLLDVAKKVTAEDSQGTSADLATLTGRPAGAPATDAGAGAPAAAGSDPALSATIDSFLGALREGRMKDLMGMTYIPDAAKPGMQPVIDLTNKMDRVDKAFRAKFGKGFIESASSNPMMGQMANMNSMAGMGNIEALKTLKSSDFKVAINGDTASATNAALPQPLNFKKVGAQWLVYDKNMENAGPQMAAMAPMLVPIGKAFDELASDVEAGKYADANAAMVAFGAKVQALMAQMMGGKGGGG